MVFKVIASMVAAALLMIFIGPVVVKLKELSLSIVVLIGLAMMLTDIWQALRSKDD